MIREIEKITWEEYIKGNHHNFFPTPLIKWINGKICQLYDSNVIYPDGETFKIWVEVEEIRDNEDF